MRKDLVEDYANDQLGSVTPGLMGADNGSGSPVYYVCVSETPVLNLQGYTFTEATVGTHTVAAG